jgi:hypothetical protein
MLGSITSISGFVSAGNQALPSGTPKGMAFLHVPVSVVPTSNAQVEVRIIVKTSGTPNEDINSFGVQTYIMKRLVIPPNMSGVRHEIHFEAPYFVDPTWVINLYVGGNQITAANVFMGPPTVTPLREIA